MISVFRGSSSSTEKKCFIFSIRRLIHPPDKQHAAPTDQEDIAADWTTYCARGTALTCGAATIISAL